MTEEEAKKKLCPDKVSPATHYCVTSKCMAWQEYRIEKDKYGYCGRINFKDK